MDQLSFGRRLFKVRRSRKITSNELAKRIGKSSSYIRQLECGKRKPSFDMLNTICNELEISPNYLLTDTVKTESMTEIQDLCMKVRRLSDRNFQLVQQLVEAISDDNKFL